MSNCVWLSCASLNPGEIHLLSELVSLDRDSFAYELSDSGVVRVRVPDLASAAWLVERLGWLRAAQKLLECTFRLQASSDL